MLNNRDLANIQEVIVKISKKITRLKQMDNTDDTYEPARFLVNSTKEITDILDLQTKVIAKLNRLKSLTTTAPEPQPYRVEIQEP